MLFLKSSPSLNIRRATLEDIPAIAALHRSALDKEWTRESFETFISFPTNTIWVAQHDDPISGFLITQTVAGETEIISLAVSPVHRRNGIASAFMRKINPPCFLEVRADNHPANAFYAKHNFTQVGIRKDYYSTAEGKKDALILRS